MALFVRSATKKDLSKYVEFEMTVELLNKAKNIIENYEQNLILQEYTTVKIQNPAKRRFFAIFMVEKRFAAKIRVRKNLGKNFL